MCKQSKGPAKKHPAAMSPDPQPSLIAAARIALDFLGPLRLRLIHPVLFATLSVLCELATIWLSYDLIRAYIEDEASRAMFWGHAAWALLLVPAGYFFFGLATGRAHHVAFAMIHNLRKTLSRHLLQLPLGQVMRWRSGGVRKMMVDEPEQLELLVAHAIPEGTSALMGWALVSVWLFVLDWPLALAAIVLTPLSFGLMGLAMARAQPEMVAFQRGNTQMNAAISEFLAGIAEIKMFQRSGQADQDARRAVADYGRLRAAWGHRFIPLGGTFNALVLANITLILPVGLWRLQSGAIDLATFLLFVILGGNYSTPLMRLFNIFHKCAQISISAHALQKVFELPAQSDSKTRLALSRHDICFENVSFAYDSQPVLHDLNFTAAEGQITALVGPSGSGKSTIAYLIARFQDPQSGRVLIGDQDLRHMDVAQAMETVSFVFQDTFLFAGTIAENLRFACPEASMEQITAAARAAQAHEFITALPAGYDTVIGDGSGRLSGGERQRLAIARAILKDAPIIILDEATAFADPDCEAEIQAALSELARGKTVIVVAHRLHTIMAADQILVLDKGRKIECGTHPDLLAQNGLYARLWQDYTAARTTAPRATDAADLAQEMGR